jgi:hypothetical protein
MVVSDSIVFSPWAPISGPDVTRHVSSFPTQDIGSTTGSGLRGAGLAVDAAAEFSETLGLKNVATSGRDEEPPKPYSVQANIPSAPIPLSSIILARARNFSVSLFN